MPTDGKNYDQVKELTAMNLRRVIETTEQLTHLSLPERSALADEIARVVPAGNVPSLVAAGLAKLPGRAVPVNETRRNLNLLMQGMQTFMDKAVFQTFFVGPATVLSAYQMLLKLAGKDVEESFPEGTWQFYVEFGLREDSGRHACETIGFEETLEAERIRLTPGDELACWLAASAWLLERYDTLLTNEWTEHVRLRHLSEILQESSLAARWLASRPYAILPGSELDFTDYRQAAFEAFCNGVLADANPRLRKKAEDTWNHKQAVAQRAEDLAAYLRQMTIRSNLEPTSHSDLRMSITPSRLAVGVVSGGRYYMIDINGPNQRADIVPSDRLRVLSAAILRDKPDLPTASLDKLLCTAHRSMQPALRDSLPEYSRTELDRLRQAPILLNWDSARSDLSLAEIRSGRRGIGDHALTIFRASQSTVFDLSHIFFDGPWGMAVAEIMTGQATRYAQQLKGAARIDSAPPVQCLDLDAPQGFAAQARKAQLSPETSAETTAPDCKLIQQVKDSLRKRNEKLLLTFNDILVLHRVIFGQLYQPSSALMKELKSLAEGSDPKSAQAGEAALKALDEARQGNPALLIPIDASGVDPRERIYPTTFRNPFRSLLNQHQKALAALDSLETANRFTKPLAHRTFEDARRDYLGTLHAFGQLITRYKDVSMKGESVSTATIKLLAGLPPSVQRMLDSLPSTFDVVNDVVKGQEVFSNVGRVSSTSSLRRFNTAKDDNEKKVLAWGVMTDADGIMHISLRDSRPHVAALIAARHQDTAQGMTQEFLDAYALTLNAFLAELLRIARGRHPLE